jgi:putative SOS response-associated peptidase YedK
MCGRYTLISDLRELAATFGATVDPHFKIKARYNIAPSQTVAVVVATESDLMIRGMHWGLVPFWAKEKSIGNKMINARSETVSDKPSFKQAFLKRRCVVLADGFYEWRKEGSVKTPLWIHLKHHEPIFFAGLWESWHPPDDKNTELLSTTILTTAANEFMKSIHDRMPVILSREDALAWLDPHLKDPAKLGALLKPLSNDLLVAFPVSKLVNSPTNDRPECIEPAPSPTTRRKVNEF